MIDILTNYGYTYIGQCHCDGSLTEKYGNGDYEVRVKVRKRLFKIKHAGRSKTMWIPETKLEESLKQIHLSIKEDHSPSNITHVAI
jgi:hypothetical protein